MEKLFELVKSESVPLTRKLATEMKQMKPSPTERELDPKRVDYLRDRAEKGLLVNFNWAKVRVNGDWLRMNGQHSSVMLCDIPDDIFPTELFVHLDEYKAKGDDGLTTLFQQFDARKSTRTKVDVAGAYKGMHPELEALDVKLGLMGLDGIVFYLDKIIGSEVPKGDEVCSLFNNKKYWPFLLWLAEVYSMKTPELRKAPIVSAIYATYEKNEVAAKQFWHDVSRGGKDYEDNHPASVLSAFYQEEAKKTDSEAKVKPATLYQVGVYCWNAFRQQKTLKRIDIKSKTSVPATIKNISEPEG